MQEHWRRVFQRATVTGDAWGHAPPLMPETGGSALLSPSLPFPAGGESPSPATARKTHTKQSVLKSVCFCVSKALLIKFENFLFFY